MFINCRHCNTLVATDPATGLPPERCPRCAGVLRLPAPAAEPQDAGGARTDPSSQADTRSAAAAPAVQPRAPSVADPDAGPGAGPVVPRPASAATAAVATPTTTSVPSRDATSTPDAEPAASTTPPAASPGPAAPAVAPASVADVITPVLKPALVDDTTPRDPGLSSSPVQPDAPAATPDAQPDAPAAAAPEAAIVDAPAATPSPAPAESVVAPPSPTGEGVAAATPGFLGGTRAPRPAHRRDAWRQPAAIAALLVLLCLQIVLADRARLAADARWRPLVAGVCDVLGCSVPAWHEPQAFVLLAREVAPHPQRGDALRARASFRNEARWPQAWPQLLLTLSDVDGRAVAAGAFTPDQYLDGAPATPLIEPGQTVDIALDIGEPSAETVSYAWDLR